MFKLMLQTLQSVVIGLVILGLLLFVPAGTLNYWQAWVFIIVFLTSANAIGLYLTFKDPALLERRKKVGPAAEQNPAQKVIFSIIIVVLIGFFIFCGLDFRFGWSPVPPAVSIVGDVLVALGLFINLIVFRENSFGGPRWRWLRISG